LPDSREINAFIAIHPHDFELWDGWGLVEATGLAWKGMVLIGATVLQQQAQIVKKHVGFAAEIDLLGHKVLCANATVFASEIAGELATGRPFGVVFFCDSEGKFVYSLRSNAAGIDVSEIAKQFGGGGHRNAAGFKTQYLIGYRKL
jgi:nanoRNase/pAp phosphatase (c-di-AMP/oligoRNAs hydrolase)